MEKISGTIKEIVYYANGFGVIKFTYGKTSRTAAGRMPKPCIGATINMEGEWQRHPKYKLQFVPETAAVQRDEIEPESLLSYLKSGFLFGVGPSVAERIYETFGDETLRVFEQEPERLCEITGITQGKSRKIQESYQNTRQYVSLAAYLRSATKYQIMAIYQQYGERSVSLLKEDIYRIIRDIEGIGFTKADKLAAGCGVQKDSSTRIRAAIVHVLQKVASEGHCFMHEGSLGNELRALLKMPVILDRLRYELSKLEEQGEVINEEGNIYLASIYKAECQCGKSIDGILTAPANRIVPKNWIRKAILDIEIEKGFSLTDEQKAAVEMAMEEKMLIITGGPGSGKTTVVNAILRAWNHPESVLMVAPTGCAAYQLTATTGKRAYTIQRGLGYGFHGGKMGFEYHAENRMPFDLVIMDESTMPNVVLMAAFLQAVRSGAHLIMIGDKDQLPSIGPGKVFDELMKCGHIPTVKLTVGHRQTDIITINVNRINQGLGAHTWSLRDGIFQYHPLEQPEDIQKRTIQEYERLVKRYGVKNVRCLTATKQKSAVSTEALNPILRELVNPTEGREALSFGSLNFYPNDRVMYTKENNYDKDVFNGEMGTVLSTNPAQYTLEVVFDDGSREEFRGKDLRNLELCYAQTINKSMGSECEAAVIAFVVPPILWSRNLLYTAVSRAKKEVTLTGTEKTIENSLASVAPIARNTNLKKRIKGVKSI